MKKIIEGNKINLRFLKLSDAESMYKYAKDRAISRTTFVPYPYTLDHALSFIRKSQIAARKGKWYAYGIEKKSSPQIIGIIGIHAITEKHKRGDLGYWLGKKFWGEGIVSEAVEMAVKACFMDLKFNKLTACVLPGNLASSKILKRNGFIKEGTLRKQIFKNRKWQDIVLYGILREDFKKKLFRK